MNGNLNVKYVQRLKNVLYVLLQFFVVKNKVFFFDLHKILSDVNAMNRSKKKKNKKCLILLSETFAVY